MCRYIRCVCSMIVCAPLLLLPPAPRLQAQQAAQNAGRIAGIVIDGSTGRPIPGAAVEVVGTPARSLSDLEGRFRTPAVPAGAYTVQAGMLSYALTRVDSVRVNGSQVTTLRIVMQPQAIELEAVSVTVTGQRAATAAGLLAAQKRAPAVMDGISSEQMSRSPDSDAADAIARVTGVSVVDNKYVVARGLQERYSNTLLNGVELASPEPTRRIVPLDIFPAALLESIVVSKTATPDLPGDFAGGSVNIQTKDFPEARVLELKVSQGYNSLSTFKNLYVLPRNGVGDMIGFDRADRTRRPGADFDAGNFSTRQDLANALVKTVRPVWSGSAARQRPDLGVSLQYGDQLGEFERALGYVVSFDYGFKTTYEPAEYFAVVSHEGSPVIENTTEHATTTADWGLLGNATLRLGASHTLSLKNLLTQESEEFVITNQSAFNVDEEGGLSPVLHRYQVRYLERAFWQSQLRGQHQVGWPFRTRWNWNASFSRATRDEPENRALTYGQIGQDGPFMLTSQKHNFWWFRFLDDRIYNAQLDLSIPLGWWPGEADALFKVGASGRLKERDFDAYRFDIKPNPRGVPDGLNALSLPPHQALAPENIGRNLVADPLQAGGLPYSASDEVRAAYIMADLPLFLGIRAVGGVRMEQWALEMINHEPPAGRDSIPRRNTQDLLWSANLTLPLSERMNLRAAGYRTVSRPDPREIALGSYSPVAGQCAQVGNPELDQAQILNADLRWEWYPAPGELISLSGFYKLFTNAIVEIVGLAQADCIVRPENARTATNLGGELELRKGLGFLHGALSNISLGLNFTYVDGKADLLLGRIGQFDLDLQDQSKYLGNASLSYFNPEAGLSATVLYNYFADRVTLYGDIADNQAGGSKMPDIIEKGRGTVDFKVAKRFRNISASLSGRNLTNQIAQETQMTDAGATLVGLSRPGVSFSLSLGYVF